VLLLLDIGNTNTHLGLATTNRVVRHADFPTDEWSKGAAQKSLRRFIGHTQVEGIALCSVVPRVTARATKTIAQLRRVPCLELTPQLVKKAGLGIAYPKPETIGQDRLANAVAVRHHFGAPSVVVDFGTAVTFDVVDRDGHYIGGIIAPGLVAMTDYLHEKTALLPRIKIREIGRVIGKSTEQAMLAGALHGYRGLVRALILELKRELKARRLPVVATGGYAKLIAAKMPEITAVDPLLTLEGLRLVYQVNRRSEVNSLGR
jgi:type III pantothenate kinase